MSTDGKYTIIRLRPRSSSSRYAGSKGNPQHLAYVVALANRQAANPLTLQELIRNPTARPEQGDQAGGSVPSQCFCYGG